MTLLARALPDMTCLTELVVPYIATDRYWNYNVCRQFFLARLVAGVGRHCPRLRLLDLSGTEEVREQSDLLLSLNVTDEGSTKPKTETLGSFLPIVKPNFLPFTIGFASKGDRGRQHKTVPDNSRRGTLASRAYFHSSVSN